MGLKNISMQHIVVMFCMVQKTTEFPFSQRRRIEINVLRSRIPGTKRYLYPQTYRLNKLNNQTVLTICDV